MQGMILIADPAYNEPNVEQMRATTEGEARSRQYNAEVRTRISSGPIRHVVAINSMYKRQYDRMHSFNLSPRTSATCTLHFSC